MKRRVWRGCQNLSDEIVGPQLVNISYVDFLFLPIYWHRRYRIHFAFPRVEYADWKRPATDRVESKGLDFFVLLTPHCPFPSHQTTKFPPTPFIRSTSASHVRMVKLQYCTLTVIMILATISYVYPESRRVCLAEPPPSAPSTQSLSYHALHPHIPLHLPALCERTATPTTPFRSCAYFTVLWIPRGRGSPAFLRELCARRLPRPQSFRAPLRIFRRSGLQPQHQAFTNEPSP